MSLLDGLRALIATRADHVAAITAIDAELADVRAALGLSTPEPPRQPRSPTEVVSLHTCQRCGEPFTPAAGVSGKWCSRRCYEGIAVDDRRDLILKALETAGVPLFPSALRFGDLADVSSGTLNNDLYALHRRGLVKNTDDGWVLVGATVEAASQESAVPDPPQVPLVQPPPSLN